MESFPQILFSVWESKITGHLPIKIETAEKTLAFKNGNLAIEKDTFEEKAFLKHLIKKKILDNPSGKKCEAQKTKKKISLLAAILELGILSPQHLWKNMELFAKQELFPLFDLSPLASSFVPEKTPSDTAILFTIPTLNFIKEGIYRMKNTNLINALIPKEAEDFQKLTPDYMDQIVLEPYEEHLISIAAEKADLHTLILKSTLGEKYTKKALLALFFLGILGPSPMATPNKPLQEFSVAELNKILDTFNAKCSYIYKSVSKELGPVALNLMEKSIEEIKPHLSQHFQKIRLEADGNIDMQTVLKSNLILSDRDTIQKIIKSLNEILTAEILAVKKSLGSEFESTLIKNLETIGG
ncbi:MAG: hypothetical protein JSV17_10995 [Candidatus Aminicenantes bacterium]|nr:MAG: hypothetical protein JSV17_10995 [Candidatus Aminicenantes bacterium]